MTIQQDVLKAAVPALIELFEIDLSLTHIPALTGTLLRLTPSRIAASGVNFGGLAYLPFPIEISGIEHNSDAAPARPHLSIANIDKYLGSLAFVYSDIIGASVVYIRTFEPYLELSSRLSMPPVKFIIAQKITHNKNLLTFELRSPRDKERAFMPARQMLTRDFPGLGVNKNVR